MIDRFSNVLQQAEKRDNFNITLLENAKRVIVIFRYHLRKLK